MLLYQSAPMQPLHVAVLIVYTCRELIHWRGEPDPFKGDVPNARVREFAKEVVEVMFNSAPVQNNSNTLAAQVRQQAQDCWNGS